MRRIRSLRSAWRVLRWSEARVGYSGELISSSTSSRRWRKSTRLAEGLSLRAWYCFSIELNEFVTLESSIYLQCYLARICSRELLVDIQQVLPDIGDLSIPLIQCLLQDGADL